MSNLSYYTKKYKKFLLTKGNLDIINSLTKINNLVYYINKLEQNSNYELNKSDLYFNYKHRMGVIDDFEKLPILNLIKQNHYLNYNNNYYNNNNNNNNNYKKYIKTNIIVIPNYLVNKWKTILKEYNLSYLIITNKNQFKSKLEDYNNIQLLLITNTKYHEFYDTYKNINKYIFSRVIYDEADTLKIVNCKKLNSIFYWFLTNSSINLLFPLGYFYNKDYKKIKIPGLTYSGFIKNTFYSLEVNSNNMIEKLFFKLKNYKQKNIETIIINKKEFNNILMLPKLLIIDSENKINHKLFQIELFNKNKYKRLTINKINVLLLKDYNSYNGLDFTIFKNVLFINTNEYINNYIINKVSNKEDSSKYYCLNIDEELE